MLSVVLPNVIMLSVVAPLLFVFNYGMISLTDAKKVKRYFSSVIFKYGAGTH
jgi:hypothetical protein